MKKYLSYFQAAFRAESAYKADFLFSIVINLVYFFIYFSLWKVIYSHSGVSEINTYSLASTVTYYFVSILIFRVDPSNYIYLGWDIWEGQLTNDLIRPYNIKFIEMIITLADISINFLLYFPVGIVIFIFFHNLIVLPSILFLLLFVVSLFLGILLGLMINLALHCAYFFLGDQEASIGLLNYIMAFLAGAFFPLVFLPEKYFELFNLLPFKYMFSVPIEIFLGKLSIHNILLGWGTVLLWILSFYLIFSILMKKGLARYSGVGR